MSFIWGPVLLCSTHHNLWREQYVVLPGQSNRPWHPVSVLLLEASITLTDICHPSWAWSWSPRGLAWAFTSGLNESDLSVLYCDQWEIGLRLDMMQCCAPSVPIHLPLQIIDQHDTSVWASRVVKIRPQCEGKVLLLCQTVSFLNTRSSQDLLFYLEQKLPL